MHIEIAPFKNFNANQSSCQNQCEQSKMFLVQYQLYFAAGSENLLPLFSFQLFNGDARTFQTIPFGHKYFNIQLISNIPINYTAHLRHAISIHLSLIIWAMSYIGGDIWNCIHTQTHTERKPTVVFCSVRRPIVRRIMSNTVFERKQGVVTNASTSY